MNALVAMAHQQRAASPGRSAKIERTRARVGKLVRAVRGEGGAGDSVTITRAQRNVHVLSESIAVLVAAPFSLWLATRETLPQWARVLSGVIGVGTLAVDGGLLVSYVSKDRAAAAVAAAPAK